MKENEIVHIFVSKENSINTCAACGLTEKADIHRKQQPFEYSPNDIPNTIPGTITNESNIAKRLFGSGTTSTKQPRLSLIPHQGLIRAALRFELGIERHKEKAWNALSSNQSALEDKEWLIERCSHAIEHCYRLIDRLKNPNGILNGAEGSDDDAAAIAWCGLVLGEAMSILENKNQIDQIDKNK